MTLNSFQPGFQPGYQTIAAGPAAVQPSGGSGAAGRENDEREGRRINRARQRRLDEALAAEDELLILLD